MKRSVNTLPEIFRILTDACMVLARTSVMLSHQTTMFLITYRTMDHKFVKRCAGQVDKTINLCLDALSVIQSIVEDLKRGAGFHDED